jgi:hypothetical protein
MIPFLILTFLQLMTFPFNWSFQYFHGGEYSYVGVLGYDTA